MPQASKKKVTKKSPRKKSPQKTTARKKTKKAKKKKTTARSAPAGTFEKISSGARKLMLANLGLYGKVLDELQAQATRATKVIDKARSNPASVNKDLIKRGEELADQITDLLKRSGAPASRQLKKQMDDLDAAIDKLRRNIQR